MPVLIDWDDPAETTLRMDVIAPWNWDEYMKAVKDGHAMATAKPHTVHLIVDFTHIGALPSGYLTNFQRAMLFIPPNAGLIVSIGVTGLLRIVGQALYALMPGQLARISYADSLPAARKLIADYSSKP